MVLWFGGVTSGKSEQVVNLDVGFAWGDAVAELGCSWIFEVWPLRKGGATVLPL